MPLSDSPSLDSICHSLEQAGRAAGRSRAAVFEDWLDYAITVLHFHPASEAIRNRLNSGVGLLEAIDLSDAFNDLAEGGRLKSAYLAEEEGSWESTVILFRTALEAAIIQIATPIDGRSFVDVHDIDLFGMLYQNWVYPGHPLEMASYSTSCGIAASILPHGQVIVLNAIEQAITTLERVDAIEAIMARASFRLAHEYAEQGDWAGCERTLTNNTLPMVKAHLSPIAVVDPACGSGTMLMAASTRFPAFAIEVPLVTFIGFDIDPVCVKMARLNELLYGFNGYFTAAVNGTALPTSMIGSALRLSDSPVAHSVFPAGLFPIVEAALAANGDPDMLCHLAADARRLATAQAVALAAGRSE